MKNTCSIDGCCEPCRGRGMCQKHYSAWHEKIGPQGKYIDRWAKHNNQEAFKQRFAERWRHGENGCWIWTGAKRKPRKDSPYEGGETIVDGKKVKAHRFSWTIHNGKIPKGKCVLHKCNNSLCVNPEHLYIGTQADNMRDVAVGKRSAQLRVPDDVVRKIRALRGTLTQAKMAAMFGVSRGFIGDIFYRPWVRKHVV